MKMQKRMPCCARASPPISMSQPCQRAAQAAVGGWRRGAAPPPGDVWYVGGLAGWDGRTVRVDLSLLPEGTYAVELFRDGENAARIAQDYVREEFLLAPGKSFDVKMFPGGGFAARITKR